MTQDEIIEMATQVYGECNWHKSALLRLEAFVKLVAAKAIVELESQEPVAWQFMNGSNFRKRRPDDFVDLDSDGLPYWKPLYTTPPQRTWVGLAKEDRLTAKYMQDAPNGIEAVIDYIESKLKELNT